MPNENGSSAQTSPDGGATHSTTQLPTGPTEYRYAAGAGVPEWAVGKTAAEVLGLAVKQNEIIAGMPTAPKPEPAQTGDKPWQQYTPPTQGAAAMPTDDEWVATPQKAFEKALEANVQQRFAPMLGEMAAGLASSARAQAATTWTKEFSKYGPEIDAEVVKVPVGQRTVDLYRYAVDIVRGRHVSELAEELAQQKLAGLPGAERATGGAMSGAPVAGAIDWTKLPPGIAKKWRDAGITEATIREDCAKWGMTQEKFLEMTMNNQFISETPDGGWSVGRDLLKIPTGGWQ